MTEKQEVFTLLGNRVKMLCTQYKPTSDSVWLATMPCTEPKTVLDVGVGTGGVALCLHHHFPKAKITGIDISQDMLNACANNAKLNNCDIELIKTDVLEWSTPRTFDLVISNPPYFFGTPRQHNPKAHHNTDLARWMQKCVARVRPHGYFCTIVDAARLSEIIAPISKRCGSITIIPLFGAKKIAKRVLVRGRVCGRGDSVLHSGFPMNYEPILRDGLTIQNILDNIPASC